MTLEQLRDRRTTPRSALVHAWGAPAIVLSCGVPKPAGYSVSSTSTTVVDGVAWYQQVQAGQVVWTAIRASQVGSGLIYVSLTIPKKYEAAEAYLVDLAVPIKGALPDGDLAGTKPRS